MMMKMKYENEFFIFDNPKENGVKNAIKNTIYKFISIKYKLQMNMIHPMVNDKKYNVSVCAIFKNEAPFLHEWIEFNRIIGINHFYLYNNNSEDNFMPVLKPYLEMGLITLNEWPYDQKQMECYKDCIERFAFETKWIGFIDIDEFIVPKSTQGIYDFLRPFEKNRGAVKIYWKLYGSSALMDRNIEGLVSEDFVVCWPKYCDIGKCFYNTAWGFDKNSKHCSHLHHSFWANWKGKDIPPVNVFDNICIEDVNIAEENDFPIQINHYFTKSYEEYAIKKSKGDVYFVSNPHDEDYFFEHEMKCTAVDYSAYKYLIKLKLAMRENGSS